MSRSTAAGQEVDFVIETPKRLLPIEVEASARVTPADAKPGRRLVEALAARPVAAAAKILC